MKKALLFASIALFSLSAFATGSVMVSGNGRVVRRGGSSSGSISVDINPEIIVSGGRRIERVVVYSDRDENVGRRLRQLERAVRNLQNRMYDLEDDMVINQPTRYVCDMTVFGTRIERSGDSERQARDRVSRACRQQFNEMHCDNRVYCSQE